MEAVVINLEDTMVVVVMEGDREVTVDKAGDMVDNKVAMEVDMVEVNKVDRAVGVTHKGNMVPSLVLTVGQLHKQIMVLQVKVKVMLKLALLLTLNPHHMLLLLKHQMLQDMVLLLTVSRVVVMMLLLLHLHLILQHLIHRLVPVMVQPLVELHIPRQVMEVAHKVHLQVKIGSNTKSEFSDSFGYL